MNSPWDRIASRSEHRPWPTPRAPWAMTMTWLDLLFVHWPVERSVLAPHIPDGLTLETFDGTAWLSLVPFEMDNTLPRGLTWLPRAPRFPELNLRTYVNVEGEKPGVWFFSLDAANAIAVAGARQVFHLPYFRADMQVERRGKEIEYRSRRRADPRVRFRANYGPDGSIRSPEPESLDAWLLARYSLYSANSDGELYRAEINHREPTFQPARVEIGENTLATPLGLELSAEPARAHYIDRLDVVGWLRERVEPVREFVRAPHGATTASR